MRLNLVSDRKQGSFVGHAATYAIGNVARKLVGFAMLPIYTRYLSPADYGVIGLLTFSLALFEPIFGARLARAIPKFYFDAADPRSRRAVIWGSVGLTGTVSAITMTVLILLRSEGSQVLFGNSSYSLVLGLFAVNLLSRPIEDICMLYIRLRERSSLFLSVSMAKLALQVTLNLLLVVYWKDGVVGAVLSGVISSGTAALGLIAYVSRHEMPGFEYRITRKMLDYCWPLWLSGLAGLYVGSSGGMYLRVFDTLSDVGRLELALRFAAVVTMLVWSPFFQHWEPMSYRYFKEGAAKVKFQIAFIVISTIMFTAGLGLSIFSKPVIRVMAAAPFHSAAAIVPILTFGFILESLRSFFTFSFLVTGHTKVHGLCQYVTAVVITVLYLVLIPSCGLLGAAAAQALAFLAAFSFVRLISRRYFDPGLSVAPIALHSAIAIGAYLCSNFIVQAHSILVDLGYKLLVFLGAAIMMVYVGLRAMRSVEGATLESLPWPLDRIGAIRLQWPSRT